MWICCEVNSDFNIEIKYCIENEFYSIISYLSTDKIPDNPKLIALFYAETDFVKFTIGNFIYEKDKYILKKKYSMSYLESNNIDINKFSHFKLYMGDKVFTAYPTGDNSNYIYSDKSIIHAKEVLSSIYTREDKRYSVTDILTFIKASVRLYDTVSMPFMKKYMWYVINDININFNLSTIKYLLSEIKSKIKNNSWYFGISPIERVFAFAVKTNTDKINPFSNADDCTIVYCNEENSEFYYVIGLLLLDDGQYFCIPE